MKLFARLGVLVVGLGILGSPSISKALTLDFLDDTAISFLQQADIELQREAALTVLESGDPHSAQEWKNSSSGYSGRVQGLGAFSSADGLMCRKLRIWTQARGVESEFVFPFCKDASGEWFIASGKRLLKAEK
jgi:hypothetical protein